MSSTSANHRHYTPLEKKIFLDILSIYKTVESKKGDTASNREKEVIWKKIADMYNNSHRITQERTVQQLKKLWSNLKQSQRNAKTKERQARMLTGGGPSPPDVEIDPDVETIVPNLMATAPTIFSSNMSVDELKEQEEAIIHDNFNGDDHSFESNSNICHDIIEAEIALPDDNLPGGSTSPAPGPITPKLTVTPNMKSELALKRERFLRLMRYDEDLASVRLTSERKKNEMEENHLKVMHALEIRAATAKAELQELLLKKHIN